ncbi:MAG: hypothetical protein ACKVTZ_03475 [Bacteroidia bacterium]
MKIRTFIDKATLTNLVIRNSVATGVLEQLAYFFKCQASIYSDINKSEFQKIISLGRNGMGEMSKGQIELVKWLREYEPEHTTLENANCTVFLIDKEDKECEHLQQQNKAFYFNLNLLLSNAFLLFSYFNIWSVKPNTNIPPYNFTSWSNLELYHKYPHNAMVIIDDYILSSSFKNSRNYGIENNLFEMLDSLIPKGIDFQLSIITKEIPTNTTKKEVFDFVQNKYPNLTLGIYFWNNKGCHDRNIITNSIWLHSGNSFCNYLYHYQGRGIAVNEMLQPTQLMMFPLSYQHNTINQKKRHSVLESVKQMLYFVKTKIANNESVLIGNPNNPLLQ